MTVLRTLGFIFLILGIPIIFFLPTVFRMPDWWEPTIDLILQLGIALFGLAFALLGTYLLSLGFHDAIRSRSNRSVHKLFRLLILLVALVFVWWITTDAWIDLVYLL